MNTNKKKTCYVMDKDVHNERMQKNNQKSLFVNRALPWRSVWMVAWDKSSSSVLLEPVSELRRDRVEVDGTNGEMMSLREDKKLEMKERERKTHVYREASFRRSSLSSSPLPLPLLLVLSRSSSTSPNTPCSTRV